MDVATPRLTQLARGGGCGCKLSPDILRSLLAGVPGAAQPQALLVGTETGDDAAVWRLSQAQALVATTDFFTPIVDDPYDFGRIAATNALSDIFAMGAQPLMALALLGLPLQHLPLSAGQRILEGGTAACSALGVPIAGGHSIDSAEPMYGLAVVGIIHPERLLKNSTASSGDALILTKGLGVGVFSAALKQGNLPETAYRTMLDSTTQPNAIGAALPETPSVHAVTDVTGFGLLGHLLEMCRGAGLAARIDRPAIPVLAGAADLARAGFLPGAASRNWKSYGDVVGLPQALEDWQRALLCDPQTSGGLLIAVAQDQAISLLARLRSAGFSSAAIIGEFVSPSSEFGNVEVRGTACGSRPLITVQG